MNELVVKYIGSTEWKDHLYGSGLYFLPQQTRIVPFLMARKFLQHVDLFEQGEFGEVSDDDTANLTETAQAEKQAQDNVLNETFDVFNSVAQMDKEALVTFAKQHFNQDLNKREKVDTLRDKVRGLIDQFGLA